MSNVPVLKDFGRTRIPPRNQEEEKMMISTTLYFFARTGNFHEKIGTTFRDPGIGGKIKPSWYVGYVTVDNPSMVLGTNFDIDPGIWKSAMEVLVQSGVAVERGIENYYWSEHWLEENGIDIN